MINILLCGNEKVFDGALTQSLSITNKTKEIIHWYILTMDVSRIKPEYTCIYRRTNSIFKTKGQIGASEKSSNLESILPIYTKTEFGKCKNEGAYCTPYILYFAYFADAIPEIPDEILHLISI